MELIAVVTILALLEYTVFGALVGVHRNRSGVQAPAISGEAIFERHFRVHQNTLEQLIVFIPALWIFGRFVSAPIGALLGLLFIVGRAIYQRGYVADPAKRSTGALVTFATNAILLLGGLVGALVAWF
jgi:uncharacterized MAPEG superfamily protein